LLRGGYAPHSTAGRKLLAHELTHTLQQKNGAGVQASGPISRPGDPAERQADAMADRLVEGGKAPLAMIEVQTVPAVQRKEPPAAKACARPPEDYTGVGPAGPTQAFQAEVASINVGPAPAATLDLFQRLLMTYGLSGVEIYVYHLLERMWARSGPQPVDQFAERFFYRIYLEYRSRMFQGDPVADRALLIAGVVLVEQERLHAESKRFLACYEEQATEMAKGALDESEERVTGELKHYFGSWLGRFLPGSDDDIEGRSDVEDAASLRGLGIAAEGLAKRRNAVIAANAAYRNAVHTPSLRLAERQPIDDAQARADRDYTIFRGQVVPVFPVLEEVSSPVIHPLHGRG
jgi:hypothetical protein